MKADQLEDNKGYIITPFRGNYRHEMRHTRFYKRYHGARARCVLPQNNRYSSYGGRGIKFLWTTFDSFKEDMYESWLDHVAKWGEENTFIDRINNDGHYCKENCRWATRERQMNNRSDSKYITYDGRTQTMADWAREAGVPLKSFWWRFHQGWSMGKALSPEKFRNNKKNT